MTHDGAEAAPGDRGIWRMPLVRVTAIVGTLALLAAIGAGVWAASWADEPPRSSGDAELPPDVDEPPSPRPTPTPSTEPSDDPDAPPPAPPGIRPPDDSSAPASPVVGAPADGIATNDATPSFSGSGLPGAEVYVQLVDPGNGMASTIAAALVAADGTWTATTGAALPDGRHAVLVLQVDRAGHTSPPVRRIIVIDTVALAPTIDALPSGPQRLLPVLTGSGEPGAILTVRDDAGTTLEATAVGADGRWSLALPDPGRDGVRLTATQADAAGNISAASAPTGALMLARPSLAADGSVPSDGGATVVDFTVSGAAGTTVEVAVDGVATGARLTLSGGSAAGSTPALGDGTHTIAVRYREGDRVGAWTTVTVTIADAAAPSSPPTPSPAPTASPSPAPAADVGGVEPSAD